MKNLALLCALALLVAFASSCAASPDPSLAYQQTRESALPDGSPSGDGGSFRTEEVFCEADGERIFGVMYIPEDGEETHPALIIAHGYGGSYRDGVRYAEMLARSGYVAYCFDFRGGSATSLSDGSTLEMSFFTEQKDLESALSMVREQPYVDPDNVFLMGISQGGAVSAMTAADHPDEVKGAALFFPAFNLVDEVTEMFPSPEDIPETFDFLWMKVGRPYGDIWGFDIYDAISGYDKDVLILHGDQDSIVPISYSEKAAGVLPAADLVVIPGADHGFYGEDSDEAFEEMLDYMNRLRSPAEPD